MSRRDKMMKAVWKCRPRDEESLYVFKFRFGSKLTTLHQFSPYPLANPTKTITTTKNVIEDVVVAIWRIIGYDSNAKSQEYTAKESDKRYDD